MITVFSEQHRLHHGQYELIDGQFVPPFENPSRADQVLQMIRSIELGELVPPDDYEIAPIEAVHSPHFVEFLRTAHSEWKVAHGDTDALPLCWPTRGFRQTLPDKIEGKLGYYSFDAGTPITAGTWDAITASANVALTGASLLQGGEHAVFSLCRPPGHHAAADVYGGYCFFNNVAIAAQALLDAGANRVAVLDVDYHHGNGTQSIFYDRADCLYVSLHADPAQEFPYFLGYANEAGAAAGEGFNINLPLRLGTDWQQWQETLVYGLKKIGKFHADALLISLGVDTFSDDPISTFRLASENFIEIGRHIAALEIPSLFVLEGGYAVEELGVNVSNVLVGFEQTS